LPTLVVVGLATFNRVLESGIEDFGYASRIARLRGYYFQYAPELAGYLLSVPPAERLAMQGIGGGRGQKFLTAAAMAGLVTAVLAAVVSDHVLIAALIAGVLVAIAVFAALIRFQVTTWRRAAAVLLDDQ
jgi:predicted lysophospholipase L1 biosynthesis ABC-type transport system permease subunit